jgi:hypothetical protein
MMPYIEHNLINSELVLYRAGLHSVVLPIRILIVFIMIAAAIALWYFACQNSPPENTDLMKKTSYVLISLSLIPFMQARAVQMLGYETVVIRGTCDSRGHQ